MRYLLITFTALAIAAIVYAAQPRATQAWCVVGRSYASEVQNFNCDGGNWSATAHMTITCTRGVVHLPAGVQPIPTPPGEIPCTGEAWIVKVCDTDPEDCTYSETSNTVDGPIGGEAEDCEQALKDAKAEACAFVHDLNCVIGCP